MQRQKTLAEYQATALLLGMFYDAQINTFYRLVDGTGLNSRVVGEVDADTMEPLPAGEADRRYIEASSMKDHVSLDWWGHGDGE